jgi:hypothetical protein
VDTHALSKSEHGAAIAFGSVVALGLTLWELLDQGSFSTSEWIGLRTLISLAIRLAFSIPAGYLFIYTMRKVGGWMNTRQG